MNKFVILGFYVFLLACYPILNRRKAKYYFETKWDRLVPLSPNWVIPYVFFYNPLMVVAVWLLWESSYWQLIWSLMSAEILAMIFWYLVPNGVLKPRLSNRGWQEKIMSFVYKVDGGTNGFPSGHVFMSVICGYYLVEAGYTWGGWVAGLVVISTVLVKQHYVVDILGGLAWAAVGIWLGGMLG